MGKLNTVWFHVLAIATVAIWGTTFVATKVLINNGLTPTEIFCYRFLLAYACIWFISPRRLWSNKLLDEILMIGAGITGGSLYFITENTALEYTQASNVAMIIAITPLIATLMSIAVYKSERSRRTDLVIIGSIVALAGVITVIYNGNAMMQFNPKGDMLTLCAALSWGIYTLLIKYLGKRYSPVFLTRKVFGYGLLSLLAFYPLHPVKFNFHLLADMQVACNLLFLGIVASMLCFTAWNAVVRRIGTVKASNYINLNPIVTFVTAYFILGERITVTALAGAVAILAGVYIIERRK